MKTYAVGLVRYDARTRRLWIAGQRTHHGLTGALLAGAGIAGFAARRLTARGGVEWAVLGTILMVHDWRDRADWFRRI